MAMAQQLPAGGGVALPLTEETAQRHLDNGIWYALALWPILHVAVTNGWGGPDSADKRDWFAGAVSDYLKSQTDADQDDMEVFLLQIMQDEFDVNVEDESEAEVAMNILGARKLLVEGDASAVKELERRWKSRGSMRTDVKLVDGEVEVSDDEWDGLDDEGDTEMSESVPVVAREPKVKTEPEIDEDGFTKVQKKRR